MTASGSNIDLLCDLDRVVDLCAKVANRTLDLRMPEQRLYRTEIPSPSVNQHGFHPAEGMGAKTRRIEADTANPPLHKPGILPCGQSPFAIAASSEQ